jgi:hypothetical protein
VEIRASVIFTGGAQCRWDGEQEIEQKDPLFSILDSFEKPPSAKIVEGRWLRRPRSRNRLPSKLPTRNSFCPSASETEREGLAYE